MGLAIIMWATSTVIGQEQFGFAQCEPCEPLCDPCEPCSGSTGFFTPFTFGGWVEAGIYTNSHSSPSNGPMHSASKERRDFQMSQLYLFGEKELNTRRGFDWGGRADLVYGVDAGGMQCYGDETFDFNWGMNKNGYGMAAYQLYGTLGYRDLSVKIGKFITPIGWEESAAKNNIFYSHSYCYWIEPAAHTGVLATYDMTDRLSLNAGWTAGMDSSFQNRYDDTAVLTGFSFGLADNATVYYWINAGKQSNGANRDGELRFGNGILRDDYFVQSVCLEWDLTERFTYLLQYDLRNDNFVSVRNEKERFSSYGVNNHFLYKLSDTLTAGTRVEWLRDNGGFGYFTGDPGDYWQVTIGLRWDPTENLSFRPEVRYDWCKGATPFAPNADGDGTRSDQVSGGIGMLISF